MLGGACVSQSYVCTLLRLATSTNQPLRDCARDLMSLCLSGGKCGLDKDMRQRLPTPQRIPQRIPQILLVKDSLRELSEMRAGSHSRESPLSLSPLPQFLCTLSCVSLQVALHHRPVLSSKKCKPQQYLNNTLWPTLDIFTPLMLACATFFILPIKSSPQ